MFSNRRLTLPVFAISLSWCGVVIAQKPDSAVKDLADRLTAAPTASARQQLLTANSNLVGSELAFAILDRGHESRTHGDLKDALATFQLALRISEDSHADAARARALVDIGLVYFDQGDIQQSMDWSQKSLALSESIHDDRAAARALNSIANVYKDEGEFSLASDCYRKNLALGEALHDDQMIFIAAGNLGIINTERGDYVEALTYIKRAADLAEHLGNKGASALVLINMGVIFERQGDYEQAEAYGRRAFDLAEAAGDRLKMDVALLNVGTSQEFLGDLNGALATYEKSRAISEAIGDKKHASVGLTHMGSVHVARKEYKEAVELYQKSLRIEEEVGVKEDIAATLLDLANVRNLQGNFEEALRLAGRARDAVGNGTWIQPVWRVHLQTGNAYRGLNQAARAENEYKQAISVIEDMRSRVAGDESEQAGFFGDRLEPYSRMIDLLAGSGRDTEAFAYAERGKARTLLDVLRAGRSQLDSVLTADEQHRDQELRARLASLNVQAVNESRASAGTGGARTRLQSELDDLRLQYATFQTNLYVAHPEMKTQRGEVDPIRAEEVPKLLGSEAALVEYAIAGDKLFIFVSSGAAPAEPAGMQVFTQSVEEQKLRQQIDQFRQQLANRDLQFRNTARRLYDLVLGPAARQLKGRQKLLIIPDGSLWELPFQALVTPAGRYVFDDYSISYAPSLTALKAMTDVKDQRKRTPAPIQLLAMGNPAWGRGAVERVKAVYRDQDLGNLPMAETEVQQLGRIYGQARSHVYIGREAREARFKAEAGDSKVLHLATHGILNDASPLYSYLLLAGEDGSTEDGLLEARELLHMKLRAELAVLSACETARGRLGGGEGMIGLSWALLVSGVPTTVLSQWKVESESTSRLMIAFHENRQKNMSDAEALRAAALKIRKDPAFAHPFYWAPFIVIGAGLN
jgi:CHAT domain-containing protein/tetratricopeptide (TPR) repeat protein